MEQIFRIDTIGSLVILAASGPEPSRGCDERGEKLNLTSKEKISREIKPGRQRRLRIGGAGLSNGLPRINNRCLG
jgi:hypothetical protein